MFTTFLSKTTMLAALLVAVTLPACSMDATSNGNEVRSVVGADQAAKSAAEETTTPNEAGERAELRIGGSAGNPCKLICAAGTLAECMACMQQAGQGSAPSVEAAPEAATTVEPRHELVPEHPVNNGCPDCEGGGIDGSGGGGGGSICAHTGSGAYCCYIPSTGEIFCI